MALEKSKSHLADTYGKPLIGDRQATITPAEEDNTVTGTFDDEEVKAIVDALAGTINEIIDVLIAHGLIEAS